MCERRVTGNQLAASTEVNAHTIPAGVMPCLTCAFAATISGSSKFTKSKRLTGAYTAKVTARSARQIQRSSRAAIPGKLPLAPGAGLAFKTEAGLAGATGGFTRVLARVLVHLFRSSPTYRNTAC